MKITYPNLDLAQKSVLYDASMSAPLPPKDGLSALADKVDENSDKESAPAPSTSTDSEYNPIQVQNVFFFPGTPKYSYNRPSIVKPKTELLALRLQENNLLHKDVIVTHYRERNMDLLTVF